MKKRKISDNGKQMIIMLLSFLIPVVYMVILYAQKEIYPGGTHTVLIYDMKQQYLEFYASLRNIGSGDSSIFFNWNCSMGGNYLGLFAYYLASPFTWITLLFPLSKLPDAIYVMTLLKIGCCGLAFSIFLNRGYREQRRLSYASVLFSCCYALMSYNIIYSISLMWLDGVIFLPLILLGIERLLDGKKGLLFLITLTFCFLSNYYIAYMVGISAFIYLLYRIVCTLTGENRMEKLYVFLRFAANTLLAAGISMPLLLPTYLDLKNGKMAEEKGSYVLFMSDFGDLLKKFLSVKYDSISNIGIPSVFCGTFTLFLVAAFFLQRKRSVRQKVAAFLILAFYIVSLWYTPLYLAWHVFRMPACYPGRFSFALCAFMLIFAHDAYRHVDWRDRIYRYFRLAGVALTAAELALNGSVILSGMNIELSFGTSGEYSLRQRMIEDAVDWVQGQDGSFYRMEKDYKFSVNDPMLFGYNGLDCFTSTYHQNISGFYSQIGMLYYQCSYYNAGASIFTDALLGVKYRFAVNEQPNVYQELQRMGNVGVYRNPYALSIGFMADAASTAQAGGWEDAVFDNQNKMASDLTGERMDLFRKVDASLSQGEVQDDGDTVTVYTIELVAEDDGPLYLYPAMSLEYCESIDEMISMKWVDDIIKEAEETEDDDSDSKKIYQVTVNGRKISLEKDYYVAQSVFLGQFTEGEKVTVEIIAKEPLDSLAMASLDMDVMQKFYDVLGGHQLEVKEHKNGTLKGIVTAEEGQTLFTTIPWAPGFQVMVDGREAETGSYIGTFLTVPLEQGEHEITIRYVSPGFVAGCMIALFAGLCAAVYYRKSVN